MAVVLESPGVTPREIQILILIALGKENTEVADVLDISHKTVEGYLQRINAKLSTNNRTHAVVTALLDGLIDLAEIRGFARAEAYRELAGVSLRPRGYHRCATLQAS